LGRQTAHRSDEPLACFTDSPPHCVQAASTPKGASRVPGDHNDRHHRRQNDTKDLPSAALARRTNVWGSVDTRCGVSTAAPTTGCAAEMGRILGLLLERPSLGRVPGGRESPKRGTTWRRPIGRRSRTRLGRLGQRPSTRTVHLFGATRKRMFDLYAGNDTTPAAVASGPTRRQRVPGASVLRGARALRSASNSRASSRFSAGGAARQQHSRSPSPRSWPTTGPVQLASRAASEERRRVDPGASREPLGLRSRASRPRRPCDPPMGREEYGVAPNCQSVLVTSPNARVAEGCATGTARRIVARTLLGVRREPRPPVRVRPRGQPPRGARSTHRRLPGHLKAARTELSVPASPESGRPAA
jgi:hypothetical protein